MERCLQLQQLANEKGFENPNLPFRLLDADRVTYAKRIDRGRKWPNGLRRLSALLTKVCHPHPWRMASYRHLWLFSPSVSLADNRHCP